ncbi:MAG: sulfatase-like hydrolase/transferase, partial [Acidobacteria bacterium]|nr:sulfatase-like hydrolase/transferase [Acidobacteriota bacterium]
MFDWHRNGRPLVESGYSTLLMADEASQLIERHNGSRPFFLYLAFNAPHAPFQAPQHYLRQYDHLPYAEPDRNQRAMVKAMDDAIGQVMDALERRGVLDETLVMFLNDNGGVSEAGGNSPYGGLKSSYFEGGIRAPAVMRWPDQISAGSESDALLHVVDLFPTLAGLAGADTGGGLPLDGFDAWEAIANGAESPREEVVHSLGVIRVGDWKLLKRDEAFAIGDESSPRQLYNIAEDPYETTNLASSNPAKIAELRERLAYHQPFARDPQRGENIPGLGSPDSPFADDRPVVFGKAENTAFGAEVKRALTHRQAGNLGPRLLGIEAFGSQVKVIYDEPLDSESVPPASAFKVVMIPGYRAIEATDVAVTGAEVLLRLAQPMAAGETAGLTYEVPDSGAIRDEDDLAAGGVTLVTAAVTEAPAAPELTISAVTTPVTEGAVAEFAVRLAEAPNRALTVALSVTEGGSMLAGTPPTSVTFSAGDTVATLRVPTAGDSVVEADSAVTATVTVGTGYAVGTQGSATVTVEDDDTATFTVSADAEAISEGQSTTLTVAISNGVTFAEAQTISLAISGTASSSDYTGVPPTLTLAAGSASVTATLTAAADQVEEEAETVTVTASHG